MPRFTSDAAQSANIIAYDVCVLSCPGVALLAAIEQVVLDNANIPGGIAALNYSISGGEDPYNDIVELGFLNATAAGVFVAASAGNGGPGASTNGHNGPWVTTVAAMTHPRQIINAVVDFGSAGDTLGNIQGVGFTAGYGPAPIVYAGDHPSVDGSDPPQCLVVFPVGTFNGQIVVCDRGALARVAKGTNVLAGGAGGFVLANRPAQGESTSGDAHFLPGVHIGASDADILRGWLPANSNTVATITGYVEDIQDGNADVMASFSSRGPNTTLDVIKPDVGAPGVGILAALQTTSPSNPPEFGFLSGTSMSSPHTAGAGALIAATTDWSPYEIKSA